MPVRSLNSSVARWPDVHTVDRAARDWAERERTRHPEAVAIGYHGSYRAGIGGRAATWT